MLMLDILHFLKNGKACVGVALFSLIFAYFFLGPSDPNPGDMLAGVFNPIFQLVRSGIYFAGSILLVWGIFKEIIDNS